LLDGNGRKLVCCRKVFHLTKNPQYIFSLNEEDLHRAPEQRSAHYLGQLIAVSKTEFILYDDGTSFAPDDSDTVNKLIAEDEASKVSSAPATTEEPSLYDVKSHSRGIYMRQLAIIRYNHSSTVKDPLRKMEVCIPNGYANTPPIRHLSIAFQHICSSRKQNALLTKHCHVFHQKISK
jgi:hypothetical protein